MNAILSPDDVQHIRDCENTRSPSMEWDTVALALADSHERLRAQIDDLESRLNHIEQCRSCAPCNRYLEIAGKK